MKRFLALLMALAVILFTLSLPISASDEIKVMLDGKEISFDVPPQIINGRTMVPIRAVFEALGATLEWNAATRTAKATIDDYVVECTIDSKTMTACGEKIEMDVAPLIVDGRTLMPIRYAAEAFSCKVGWAEPIRTAFITSYGYVSNAPSNGVQ